MRGSRILATLALALAVALIAAVPAAASIWTPVASGTAGTISAIATPKAGEVVFTTTAGDIYYLAGGTFTKATLSAPALLPFEDVAMSPEGTLGIAVGEGGEIYRSTDSGVNWTKLFGLSAWSGPCGGGSFTTFNGNLFSVHFAGPEVIYITGANNTVFKSINGGLAITEVNKDSSSCLINEPVGDTAWRDPNTGFLLSNDLGALWRTTDGIGGGVGTTTKIGGSVNGFEGGDRLALDAADPLWMWATNPGVGVTYLQFSVNAGASWNVPTLTDGSNATSFLDIASGIGTNVIAVGASGAIYTSTDGVDFNPQKAEAPYTTNTWESVAFQPFSTTAWVGGTNGALLKTTASNALPVQPIVTLPTTTVPTTTPVVHGGDKRYRCRVPNLKGKSLKVATKKLKAAHCALGKVTKKEGATNKGGKVTKESQRPGKSLPAGTKIKVTLAP